MSSSSSIVSSHLGLSRRGLWLRALLPCAVFWLGYLAFAGGASVSERAVPGTPLHWIYYSLGLFVLGGLDLGTPSHGPGWAQAMLWLAFFAAPAVTATALFEAVWLITLPVTYRLRRLRDHTVIVGCGHLAELYLQKLRAHSPGCQVVLVERDANSPRLEALTAKYPAMVIKADINRDATLALLQLKRARRVLLLTGSDFTNLNAAFQVLERAPVLAARVVLHLGNLGLLQNVDLTRVARETAFFNSHAIAARQLVEGHLLKRFEQTSQSDMVVLAAFGRFSQCVLQTLQERARGKFSEVIIADRQLQSKVNAFSDRVGFAPSYAQHAAHGDVLDCSLWNNLQQRFDLAAREPLIIVGSDDDMTNLEAALWLRRRFPSAYIVARQFRRSTFSAELAGKADILLFAIAELISDAMPLAWCDKPTLGG